MNLHNKRLVVTGANGSLGRALVQRATELGAEVIRVVQRSDGSDALAVDLADAEQCLRVLAPLADVDVLCNVAGGFTMAAFASDNAERDWQAMQMINVNTARNACRALLPGMVARGSGAIVNVGALGALRGSAQLSAYGAAKAALMHLTESLSAEYRERGININAVLPSIIDTPANRAAMPQADPQKWVSPQQLANVMCFLASDEASAMHGALLPVRGLS